jgi:hypothetical protein
MLRFLYQGDYDDEHSFPDPNENESGEANASDETAPALQPVASRLPQLKEESLMLNVKVYIIADKLEIPDLKAVAASKYKTLALTLYDTQSFYQSTELLYCNTMETDRLLREVIAGIVCQQIDLLIRSPGFSSLIKSQGDLGLDVLRAMAQKNADLNSKLRRLDPKNLKPRR